MAGATIAPGLPGLVEHYANYPEADFLSRFILTAPGLAIALSATLSGWVADKLGRRTLLQIGVVLYIISGSAGLWLDDLLLLLTSRLLLGLAVGMIMVCSMALLTDHFQGPERDRAMGIQSSAMSVGGIVFLSAGSILADVSWRRFPKLHVALIYPLAFISMLMFYFIPTQLPFFALELGATSLKYGGFAVALSQVFAAVASANYQRLRVHLTNQQVLLLSYGCLSSGFLFLSMANSLLAMYLCMPFIGIGLGFNFPNLSIWLMSKVPSTMRGRASGGMTSAVFIGQFISPLLSQPVVQAHSVAAAFLVASVGMLVVVIVPTLLFLFWHHRQQ